MPRLLVARPALVLVACAACRGVLGIDPLPALSSAADAAAPTRDASRDGAAEGTPHRDASQDSHDALTDSAAREGAVHDASCDDCARHDAAPHDARSETHPDSGPGPADAGAWTPEDSGVTGLLHAVWGAAAGSSEDVYVVGGSGQILHSHDHGSWVAEAPGSSQLGDEFVGVWGTGSTDVYVVADDGDILHSNGDAVWIEVAFDHHAFVTSVWGADDQDIYIGDIGISRLVDAGVVSQNSGACGANALWGSGPNNLYAVCRGSLAATIYHSTGDGNWAVHASEDARDADVLGAELNGIWGSGPNDVYAVGGGFTVADPGILHASSDGGFDVEPVTGTGLGVAQAVWGSGPNDVYVITRVAILHSTGHGDWTVVPATAPGGGWSAVWGSGPDDVYVVGGGTILHHP